MPHIIPLQTEPQRGWSKPLSSLRKSDKAPRDAVFEFLIQYRRTPTASGYSPSKLLSGRQIRTKLDLLLTSPAHRSQGKQARIATKAHSNEVLRSVTSYEVGDLCYALYYGPRHSHQPRWVPAIITKRHGTRNVNVRALPRGPAWRRHFDHVMQLRMTRSTAMIPTTIKHRLYRIMNQNLRRWRLQTTPCQVRVTTPVTRPLVRLTLSMGLKIRDVRNEYVNHGSYVVVECMVAKCFSTVSNFVGEVL